MKPDPETPILDYDGKVPDQKETTLNRLPFGVLATAFLGYAAWSYANGNVITSKFLGVIGALALVGSASNSGVRSAAEKSIAAVGIFVLLLIAFLFWLVFVHGIC